MKRPYSSLPFHRKTIEGGEIVEVKQRLKAKYQGKRELIGSLNSKQLRGITGSVVIEVLPEAPLTTAGSTDEKEKKKDEKPEKETADDGIADETVNETINEIVDETAGANTNTEES